MEYQPGNLNVIITIPHGGYLNPASIPQRDAGSYINGQCVYAHNVGPKDHKRFPVRYKRDNYTQELGFLISQELTVLTLKKPHVVINHVKRAKVDVNSKIEKGTFGVPEAVEAWNAYHNFIEKAKRDISGPGLLVDIHGHSHPEDWIELGYTLSHDQLNDRSYKSKETSIHCLASRTGCGCSSLDQMQVRHRALPKYTPMTGNIL